MYEYDWDRFKAARVEALHIQELTLPPEMDDGTYPVESPLTDKFLPRLSNEYDTFGSHSRYWWLDELENSCLAVGVPALTAEEKELLTLVIIDRCSTREIARRMQLPQRIAARKLARVFSRLQQEPCLAICIRGFYPSRRNQHARLCEALKIIKITKKWLKIAFSLPIRRESQWRRTASCKLSRVV